jgi:hypothetical protein
MRAAAVGYASVGTVNPDLDALLDPFERSLMEIARRQYVMEAFTTDLDRVTRGNPFRIRNGIMWMLLLDTRDMLVVHLASWAKGVLQEVGLFGNLQADHSGSLPRALPNRDGGDEPEWVRRHNKERREGEHAAAFTRLFPNAGAHPDGAAFDELRKAFRLRMKPLFDDRNWNRAHVFEKVSGTTAMLNFSDLRGLLSYAEQFLGDIAMVGCHSMTDRPELNVPSAEDVAPELVDVLLLGDSERAARLRGQLAREDFYAQLHARFEAATPRAGDHFFNDT